MARTAGTKTAGRKTTGGKTAGRKPKSAAKTAELELRKTAIQAGADAVDQDAPDVREFLARWAGRYSDGNLLRLWVQCPVAVPDLHKYGTWQAMGRQVKAGEKAILLVQPRTHTDPDRATPENPDGRVIHGASWVALFDISQTYSLEEMAAEVAGLRAAALKLHPDHGGDGLAFGAAWDRYEKTKGSYDRFVKKLTDRSADAAPAEDYDEDE